MSEKVAKWLKIADAIKVRENARYKPSPHLEVRIGARKTSFRVNYRAEGIKLRKTIHGRFKTIEDWEEASREVEALIFKERFGEKEIPADLVRTEEICRQLLLEAEAQDPATIAEKKNTYINHLIPWFNDHCPFASDLTVETWPRYKAFRRAKDPTCALENDVKRFRTVRLRAFELGIIKQKFRVNYDIKKEEFREAGQVIPDDILEAMLTVAEGLKNPAWHVRILLGRFTGLRPKEARHLRKKAIPHPKDPTQTLPPSIEFLTRDGIEVLMIRIHPEDNKEDRFREFEVTAPRVVRAVRTQAELDRYTASPYLFPMKEDMARPMDKYLGTSKVASTWHWIVAKAGGAEGLTPHDLRHTYATEMFAATTDWAQLCYQLDMSLETANEVYLHFKAQHTRGIAQVVSDRLKSAQKQEQV